MDQRITNSIPENEAYESPRMEQIELEIEDVILASGGIFGDGASYGGYYGDDDRF